MPLIDDVRAVCDRLATQGWGELLAAHGLDLGASDLASELARPLDGIDRGLDGFGDFAQEGTRGVEPGQPARSLLFHALASPNVVNGADGAELGAFPTLAELDAVENYVFGARPPSLPELLAQAHASPVAVVAFAVEYRPSIQTVHQRHADLCFARTGVARVGTAEPLYDARLRGFLPFVDDDPHAVRVLPARYAAYLAVRVPGAAASFVPMRFRVADAQDGEKGDQARRFWVPIHKLFSGPECIRGLDLHVSLQPRHVNEKLRRIHMALGTDATWHEPEVSLPPFRFTEGIAALATDADLGPATLVPTVHPRLVEPAEIDGKPVTFRVPPNDPLSSSLNIPAEGRWRHGPEYVHVRHQITDAGEEVDLNARADVEAVVAAGGYDARHYVDFTGDGWIDPLVPELAVSVPRRAAAYSLVTAPDFFTSCDQRELTEWAASRVPSALRRVIWGVPPDPLSDQRFAANLQLDGARFQADDDTVTAIVSLPVAGTPRPTRLDVASTQRHSHLPDDAAGVFAPGWDAGVDGRPGGPEHLAAYGLGSPFPEDSKLCAALSSFWPAVAPDATRTFEPSPRWATVIPLTDAEVGSEDDLPWDGVPGPRLIEHEGRQVMDCASLANADYVVNALAGRFSLSSTGRIAEHEYEARVLAMLRVYQVLGVDLSGTFDQVASRKARWAVLSFRTVDAGGDDLTEARTDTGAELHDPVFAFTVVLHGTTSAHPTDVSRRLVEIQRMVALLVDPVTVLRREGSGRWEQAGG